MLAICVHRLRSYGFVTGNSSVMYYLIFIKSNEIGNRNIVHRVSTSASYYPVTRETVETYH
jgi:hypothetical protein